MSRVAYFVGAPGSGKSTLARHLLDQVGPMGEEIHLCRETWVVPFGQDCWMMGRVRAKFPGTDALGRAACRYFREWIEDGGVMPPLVLGEGIRLANLRFLLALDNYSDLTVYNLQVPRDTLEARRVARDGESQLSSSFVTAVQSSVSNLVGQLRSLGVAVQDLDGSLGTEELALSVRL